jgi:DNA-binding response OmpR family regulator
MPVPLLAHVVVLDGSPVVAEAYGNFFASADFRVTTLTDCTIDPAAVLRLVPDLLVLDLRCGPGLGGLGFLRRLRADVAGRDVPVIASPTIALIDQQAHAAELRALDAVVLPDPFTVNDLLARASAAVVMAREVRRRVRASRDDLHPVRRKTPPA